LAFANTLPKTSGMASFSRGLQVQLRVIHALLIRELVTRFGRENIGFLWIMAEPLLFAGLVGLVWSFVKGPQYHGISVVAFVATGYIPLTFLRQSFGRSTKIFISNSALLYHRQVKILDFIFVRVAIETIGAMMAYVFAGTFLYFIGSFPIPADVLMLVGGGTIYVAFVFAVCTVLAPLSEMSEVVEKIVPVSVYVAIPFSGAFNMASWVPPNVREVLLWSPMVTGMEMMRYGVFGSAVTPYYDIGRAFALTLIFLVFGLILSRRVRRMLTLA
jgi:capsular polysaccharide transport system permease protein